MSHYDTEVLSRQARRGPAYKERTRLLSWSTARSLVFLAGDVFALVVAHMLALRVTQRILHLPMTSLNPSQYHAYYIPFFTLIFYLYEGYKNPALRRPERELELGCKAVSIGFVALVLFNFVVFHTQPVSRYLMFIWFAIACVCLLFTRFTLRALNDRLWKAGIGKKKTVVLGSKAGLSGYQRLLSIQRYHGYELLGWIPATRPLGQQHAERLRVPILGSSEDWEDIVLEARAEVLVVALSEIAGGDELIGRILHRSKELNMDVELYSDVLASSDLNYDRDQYSGCIRYYAQPQWSLTLQRAFKRALDIVIGLIGSITTMLLTPILGALIKIDDGGPVFYQSAYLDQSGNTKYYLKFRTMRVDADQALESDEKLRFEFGVRQKLTDDPRVTRVGRVLRKSSLDEFPQFYSILKGDLSFVGPRTIRQDETSHYGPLTAKLLSVKPGVTGFWQTMGRQTTTYEERVQMDMFYIDHWSIWLDLVIAAKTVWKVLKTEGAY